ncbi:MAG TPA: hypothetical protein VLU25_10870 [Acidobacteriota bacterium]|nr:hypothetical protein [Acidobacteriota bacterium]
MRINAKTFTQHVRLAGPYLGILTLVWLLRMLAYAAGLPLNWVEVISLSVAVEVCTVLAVVQIHVSEWGSYSNIVVVAFLLNAWSQLQIALAIIFTMVTGVGTVYTHPSYTIPPGGGEHWTHLYGQLTFVLGFGTIFALASGCLLLFLLRLLLPNAPAED